MNCLECSEPVVTKWHNGKGRYVGHEKVVCIDCFDWQVIDGQPVEISVVIGCPQKCSVEATTSEVK